MRSHDGDASSVPQGGGRRRRGPVRVDGRSGALGLIVVGAGVLGPAIGIDAGDGNAIGRPGRRRKFHSALLATGVVSSFSTWPDVIRLILILPAVQLVVVPLGILAGRDAVTPYWAAALLDEGIAVCPRCGYRPTDEATSTTCPECGLEAWRTVGETVAGREPDTDRTDDGSRS